VHVSINVLTDCFRVIIFLSIINQLGIRIDKQNFYSKVSTAFLSTHFNFRFQKGELNSDRVIYWKFFSKCS